MITNGIYIYIKKKSQKTNLANGFSFLYIFLNLGLDYFFK